MFNVNVNVSVNQLDLHLLASFHKIPLTNNNEIKFVVIILLAVLTTNYQSKAKVLKTFSTKSLTKLIQMKA